MRNCLVINICTAIIFLLLRNSSSSTAVILKSAYTRFLTSFFNYYRYYTFFSLLYHQ